MKCDGTYGSNPNKFYSKVPPMAPIVKSAVLAPRITSQTRPIIDVEEIFERSNGHSVTDLSDIISCAYDISASTHPRMYIPR